MKKPLTDSKRYRDFVSGRDQALEQIFRRYLRAMHQVIDQLEEKVLMIAQSLYGDPRGLLVMSPAGIQVVQKKLDPEFHLASMRLSQLLERMRRSTYLLSHLGEAQALARALGKIQNHYAPRDRIQDQVLSETPSGGGILARTDLALSRLQRDVLDAIQLSLTLKSPAQETMERIKRAFPHVTEYQKAPKILKNRKMAEADHATFQSEMLTDSTALTTGIFDDESWQQVIDDYYETDLPSNIFRRTPYDHALFHDLSEDPERADSYYDWEYEQEVTEDFVGQVRDGTMDAAKENGINDFQWVSVIDNRTDECCSSRDGMTSEEIEKALDEGKLDSSLCDATVAPAHFNCRCKMVPMSEDMPEESPPDFGSFDDWLEEQANP